MFTGGGELVDVASNVAPVLDVWLEWFGWHLTSVDVDGQDLFDVVIGVLKSPRPRVSNNGADITRREG